jgi:lipopolysaccharide/colanic/teichoic acid biosynthesis glycosyltransferase
MSCLSIVSPYVVGASLHRLIDNGLRAKIPSSRSRVFSRIAPFDIFWTSVSPILAFLIRDGSLNRVDSVAIYCATAVVVSLVVFQWFKISSPIPTFFSVHDALAVIKACLTTAALTAAVIFIFSRLDYAPRSIPIIHFLVLGTGLVGSRALSRVAGAHQATGDIRPRSENVENILIIGATKLAWFFSKMMEEFTSNERRIIAVLDERSSLHNRTLNGYVILGSPANLKAIVDEYSTHGVEINKVIVAAHPNDSTAAMWNAIRETCRKKGIAIEWLYERFLSSYAPPLPPAARAMADRAFAATSIRWSIWSTKRFIDVVLAIVTMAVIAPLTMIVAFLVLIDVGSPIVFWQQRIGHLGRPLHIYKFRTMRNTFGRDGRSVPETERVSHLGWLLRRSHLDEIPQLFNILIGDMSLVGPRPLLPVDQPKNIHVRLHVRPGLTGLAQINGGTLLSPDEKEALDEWYVRHASLLLDIKIILQTMWVIVRGHRRNESAISRVAASRNSKPSQVRSRIARRGKGKLGASRSFKRPRVFKV